MSEHAHYQTGTGDRITPKLRFSSTLNSFTESSFPGGEKLKGGGDKRGRIGLVGGFGEDRVGGATGVGSAVTEPDQRFDDVLVDAVKLKIVQ